MIRRMLMMAGTAWLVAGLPVLASDAETSATAGSSRFHRDGTAGATARYEGDVGFARTSSRSGRISTSRGVAVGVDRDGLALSVSQAVAPRHGPALGTTFNLGIGRDGRVTGSTGIGVANGGRQHEITAGGHAASRGGSSAVVNGRTAPGGRVVASSRAFDDRPRPRGIARRIVRSSHPASGARIRATRGHRTHDGPRLVSRRIRP